AQPASPAAPRAPRRPARPARIPAAAPRGSGAAARATASVTLLAGALTLAGAIAATQRRRIRDAVVLKVLGARRRQILEALLLEFALLGLVVATLAALLGSLAARLLVAGYLSLDFAWLPGTLLAVIAGAAAAVALIGLAGTWRALGQRPAPLLRNP
ncbi:MAG: FtsX-like permease family protein, partial [Alphaproteobacteria bacterium]